MKEIQISIKDMIYRVLLKWKAMLCVALILAILCGFGMNTLQSVISGDEPETPSLTKSEQLEKSVKSTASALSTQIKYETEIAFESYKKYVAQASEIQSYLNNSVKMNLDSSSTPTVVLQYLVNTHYEAVYPTVEYKDFTGDIISAYSSRILNTDTTTKIRDELGIDTDLAYIQELVTVSTGNSDDSETSDETAVDTMKITIYAPDEDTAKSISSTIKNEVKNQTDDIQKIFGSFDLTLVSEQYSETVSNDILSTKQGYVSNLNTIFTAINSLSKNMTTAQAAYYNALVAQYMYDGSDDETTDTEVVDVVGISFEFSALYFIVGLLAGIVIVVLIEVLKYIYTASLKRAEDMDYTFGVNVFGVQTDEKKGLDKLLEKLFGSRVLRYSNDERFSMLTAGISINAKKNEVEKLYITGSVSDTALIEKLAESLKSQLGDVSFGRSVIVDAESLEKLTSSDAVVLVEKVTDSRLEEIKQEIDICDSNGVKVLGSVVIV
jgi:hypothetical protein